MSTSETPDRRPLVYMIVAVLILGAAAVLFWPSGEKEPPAMVLTTPPVSPPSASVDTDTPGAETPSAEEMSEDSFPVEDATLDRIDDQAAAAAAQKPMTSQKVTPPPPTPKTTPSTSTLGPTSRGDYLLYVGSFQDRANAEKEVARLAGKDVPASVVSATADGDTVYRVRVGYFATSVDATRYGENLRQRLGLSFWVAPR